ncbi:hypothetical protein ACFPIF_09300 [Brevundimonas faecalis]|uniref:hypothetical protein n=1 Tax=Brevundimonas faecalis TaxID=947378 RepID=UPI003619AB6A
MMTVLTRAAGLSALLLAALGFWFSYLLPTFENGRVWVYLQVVVFIAFAVPSLIFLAVTLLRSNRYITMAVIAVLAINVLAFAITPYLPTEM